MKILLPTKEKIQEFAIQDQYIRLSEQEEQLKTQAELNNIVRFKILNRIFNDEKN